MSSTVVQFILHKYLHKIFYGIDKKNISAGILDGRITISNIGLQQNIFDNLNFPIQVNYSYVQKVQIHIPWLSQQTGLNIYISNIYAIISTKENINIYDIFMKKKEDALKQGIQKFLQSLKPKDQSTGLVKRLIKKLLDNININIGCIHLRYQSAKGYSFGLKINNILVYNVNKNLKRQFFNREKSQQKIVRYQVCIDFIGIYFNSNQTKFIFKKSPTSKSISQTLINLSPLHDTKAQYAFMTNEMRHLSFPQKLSTHRSTQLHYILIVSLKTLLQHNVQQQSSQSTNGATWQCKIQFKAINMKVTHLQYHQIKQVMQEFSYFKSFWNQYTQFMNINTNKQKNYIDIQQLLSNRRKIKTLTNKEKDSIKLNCRNYIKWIYITIYQFQLKKSFIFQAFKHQITVEKLMKNKKILKIIRKIKQQKLQDWVKLAMDLHRKFLDQVSIFDKKNQQKIKQFLNKNVSYYSSQSALQKQKSLNKAGNRVNKSIIAQSPLICLSIQINQLNLQISKLEKFGVIFLMRSIRSQLSINKQNYSLRLNVHNISCNVFSNLYCQKYKTLVPIIRKSIVQQGDLDILTMKYQKNPINQIYIHSEYQLNLQSIQIMIYPEAFKQFYQILFGQTKQTQDKKKKINNKKTVVNNQQSKSNQFQSVSNLRTKVKGKIRSPWIIFPLDRNNDPKKECWVVRLGDFNLQTPQKDLSQINEQKQRFYQKYKLSMQQFEFNYFSSINFFYSWQKFNQNIQLLKSINLYKNQKIINMIKPFNCVVDFSVLKDGLSQTIKKKNYSYISNIHIQGISIFLSNFLLNKLKERIDLVTHQDSTQDYLFLQTNVRNIYEEHTFAGHAKVTNQRFHDMNFYVILKGHYLYFFKSQIQNKYYFFKDVRNTMIRLVAKTIQKINQTYSGSTVSIYLNDLSTFAEWKKHLLLCLQKKQKKTQVLPIQKNDKKAISKNSIQKKISQDKKGQNGKKGQNAKKQQNPATQNVSSPTNSRICLNFLMHRLQIKLKDKSESQFLICNFKKSNFTYRCLYTPQATFSLSSWNIFESTNCKSNEIPFLSSKIFSYQDKESNKNISQTNKDIKSNRTLNQEYYVKDKKTNDKYQYNNKNQDDKKDRQSNNFLELKATFNQITNQLNVIYVDVDKLFIAWKVDLITKILSFFFYSSQIGDAPTPATIQKKSLGVKFTMKKFYLYCYQQKQVAGVIRLYNASISYHQNNIQQMFDINFNKFQIDQTLNNDILQRSPIYICKGQSNPMKLKYHIRKKQYQAYPQIKRLKKLFGESIIVSQLECQLRDSTIIYQHQITFRMLNYVLNHVLGTVAAKFKNRVFSAKYIFQLLKIQKISTMDVLLKNCTFIVPTHDKQRGNHLVLEIDKFNVTKNISKSQQFQPYFVQIPTQFDSKINVFFQSLLFQASNVILLQRYAKQVACPLNKKPLNLRIISSKVNLATDFYPVLNHYDDFNRQTTMKIQFLQSLTLQLNKIVFITILQVYYQNIKQKDGRGQLFQPVSPYPPKKKYIIQFPQLIVNMYQFKEKKKAMQFFNTITAEQFIIQYNAIDTNSFVNISSTQLQSQGQLNLEPSQQPMSIKHPNQQVCIRPKFELKMTSSTLTSINALQIKLQNYMIDFSMDKLNNLLQFINYDSQYVQNKLMAAKPSSFMCVHVFVKGCTIIMQQLQAKGQFFVTYMKGSKNIIDKNILQYVQHDQKQIGSDLTLKIDSQHNSSLSLTKKDITDKEIKLDGQNITISINGDQIGQIDSVYFHRVDVSSKKTMKRFKKETVQIGEIQLALQVSDLQRIKKAYDKRIKKDDNFMFKKFFQPWNSLPQKQSYKQKRRTQVEFAGICLFMVPNSKDKKLFYLMSEIKIPKLIYSTFLNCQQVAVQVNVKIKQSIQSILPQVICELKNLKVIYNNNKQSFEKKITIEKSNNSIQVLLGRIKSSVLFDLSQEFRKNQKQKTRRYLNYNYMKQLNIQNHIILRNNTNQVLNAKIGTFKFDVNRFQTNTKIILYQDMLTIFKQDQYLTISTTQNISLRNSQLQKLRLSKNQHNSINYQQKLSNLKQNIQVCLKGSILMKIKLLYNCFLIDIFQGCMILNNSKMNLLVKITSNKQIILHKGQQKAFSLFHQISNRNQQIQFITVQPYHIEYDYNQSSVLKQKSLKSQNIVQKIYLSENNQSIFNGIIQVLIKSRSKSLSIQIKQKYMLKNYTPFKIQLQQNKIQNLQNLQNSSIKYKECAHLSFIKLRQTQKKMIYYPIKINKNHVQIQLPTKSYKFQASHIFQIPINEQLYYRQNEGKIKVRQKDVRNQKDVKIYMKIIQKQNLSQIYLYTKIILSSLCSSPIYFQFSDNSQVNYQKISSQKQICLDQKIKSLTIQSSDFSQLKDTFQTDFVSNFQKNDKKNNEQCFYGTNYFIKKQVVSFGNDKQLRQLRIILSDTNIIVNCTHFAIKVYDIQPHNQMKKYQQNSRTKFLAQVNSNQQKPISIINSQPQQDKFLSLLFLDILTQTKYSRRISISKSLITYFQICPQQICKVSIICSENLKDKQQKWKRIVLQLSQTGYRLQNHMEDIVLQVRNGQPHKQTVQNKKANDKKQQKLNKRLQQENSFISDYSLEEELSPQSNQDKEILIQPNQSKQIGLKSLNSSQGGSSKILTLEFYYPLKNIDFKQNLIIQIDNLSIFKKQVIIYDSARKVSFNIVSLVEVMKDGKLTIKVYKKQTYQNSKIQKLSICLKQTRISLFLGNQKYKHQDNQKKLKLQLCNLELCRQKSLSYQKISLSLEKILFLQGTSHPIIGALHKSQKFLSLSAYIPSDLKGSTIQVSLNAFEINGRQGILLSLLQKIAQLRSYKQVSINSKIQIPPIQSNLRVSFLQQKIKRNYHQMTHFIRQQHIIKQIQILKKSKRNVCFQLLKVEKTNIFLSYIKSPQSMHHNQEFLNDPIIKYFLLLPSIGQTKLPVPNFQIKDFDGTTKQLIKKISNELKSSIGQSILYSITSLTIFDNPIQAMDDILRYILTILAIQ